MNKLIGFNLKSLRISRGVTQKKLADILGITFQQVQKYEMGTNRISAERLWTISQFFSVPMEEFFRKENYSVEFLANIFEGHLND